MRSECKFFILMGKSKFDGPKHGMQTMVIVPKDSPGVKILRPLAVFGHEHDHAEIVFDNVRVPKKNIILGIGRGFEISQARLGPGRIHHCMRCLGIADMALEALIYRAKSRVAFGDVIIKKDAIKQIVAESRIKIEQTRGIVLFAAIAADKYGFKHPTTRKYIAMSKVIAPQITLDIVDEAIQVAGAHGLSQDSTLGRMFMGIRTLKLADGPSIVHLGTIANMEISKTQFLGERIMGVNKNIEKYKKFEHVEHLRPRL